MDYQEAIEVLNNHERYTGVKYVNGVEEAYVTPYFEKSLNFAISAMQELDEYKQLGALEEVRDAVERQQAKKPVVGADVMVGRDDGGNPIWETDYVCAECGMGIAPEYVCCPYCETVIDWSEENEQRYLHPIHQRKK